jgi:hypothetical protein
VVGGFAISLASLIACHEPPGRSALARSCDSLIPAMAKARTDTLELLVTLLAGAGMDRHP